MPSIQPGWECGDALPLARLSRRCARAIWGAAAVILGAMTVACTPSAPHASPVSSSGGGGAKNSVAGPPRSGISLVIDAGGTPPLTPPTMLEGGCAQISPPPDGPTGTRVDVDGARGEGGDTGAGGTASTAVAADGGVDAAAKFPFVDAQTADARTITTGGVGGNAGGSGGIAGMGEAPPPGAGDLAMVELLINPSGTDTGREWVEVLNRAAHAISLAGLHLADSSNEAAVDFGGGGATAATAGPVLAAGARAVLVQSGDPTKNGGLVLTSGGLQGGTFGTLVSLNNDADQISLCAGPCASGTIVDRVSWSAALGASYDGHALIIDDLGRRCPATQSFGDAGSFGTPGARDPPCP